MSQEREEFELRLASVDASVARLDDSRALGALAVSMPATQDLLSVYWDTPGLNLRAAQCALRLRRIDGGRWIQTLKAHGSLPQSRAEYESPVGGSRPRLALATRAGWRSDAAALVDREALRPVFQTRVTRTTRIVGFGDGTVAELALDRGELSTAEASPRTAPILELELELVRGNRCRLYELALALVTELPSTRLLFASKAERGYELLTGASAPARRAHAIEFSREATAEEIARRAIVEGLLQVQENVECARAGRDPEGVHQMRVGVRRLRVASLVARKAALPTFSDKLARELQWLWKRLGDARDADVVATQTWPAVAPRLRNKSVPTEEFEAAVASLRNDRQRRLRLALDGTRFQSVVLAIGWICEMQAIAASQNGDRRPGVRFARRLLSRRAKAALRAGRAIERQSVADRHRLRIEAKKLRYMAEFFETLFAPRGRKRYLRRLASVQSVLGELNDLAVDGKLITSIASGMRASQRSAIAQAWNRHASTREKKLRHRLAGQWRRFEDVDPFWA